MLLGEFEVLGSVVRLICWGLSTGTGYSWRWFGGLARKKMSLSNKKDLRPFRDRENNRVGRKYAWERGEKVSGPFAGGTIP